MAERWKQDEYCYGDEKNMDTEQEGEKKNMMKNPHAWLEF